MPDSFRGALAGSGREINQYSSEVAFCHRTVVFCLAVNTYLDKRIGMSAVSAPVPVSIVQYGKIYKATYRFVLGSVSVRYIAPDGAIRQMCKPTVGRRPDSIARMILDELVDGAPPHALAR